MKTIKYLVVMLFSAFVVSSCQNEDFVNIDSLSKFGEEFSCGDYVPVWMCVSTSDPYFDTQYEWGCSGGEFYGPTDVVRTVWIAPIQTGDYDLWCTVTCGKAKETRSTVMNVVNFYYDDFETDTSGNYSKGTTTLTWMDPAENDNPLAVGAGELWTYCTGTTATTTTIYVTYKTFSNSEFMQPLTASFDFAWRSGLNPDGTEVDGYNVDYADARYLQLQLQFSRPSNLPNIYYTQFNFNIYPWKEITLIDSLNPDSESYDPTIEYDPTDSDNYTGTNYTAQVILTNISYSSTTTTTIATGYNPNLFVTDGALQPDGRGMTNLCAEILDDYTIVGYCTPYGATERVEIFRADYLALLEDYEQDFIPSRLAFGYQTLTNCFMDNYTLNNIK